MKEIYTEDVFMDSGAWALCRLHVLKQGKKAERIGKHGRLLEEPFVRGAQGDFSYYDLTKGTPFREYCDSYASFVKKFQDRIELFANIDAIGSPEVTWQIQKFFEDEHGLRLLPVIHHGTNLKWVDKYLENKYDIIGLGGYARKIARDELIRWTDEVFVHICPASNKYMPLVRVHGFALTAWEYIRRWPWYCMTDDHEVLTRSGWKSRIQLRVGEEILSYNDGISKWEAIEALHVFPDSNVYTIGNRNMEACVTGDHRWRVKDRHGEWRWLTTAELFWNSKEDFRIPRRADHHDFPKTPIHSNELVELIGWFWTDGCFRNRNQIAIYQSEKANPEKVKDIRALLRGIKGGFCETPSHPPGTIQFQIWGETVQELRKICNSKKEYPLSFIMELTEKQLTLFIQTSMKGDGCKTALKRKDGFCIGQAGGRNLDTFRIALILAGYATSVYDQPIKENNLGPIRQRQSMSFVRTSSVDWVYSKKLSLLSQKKHVLSWCVTVPSGAFFTRCKDHVYVTGNCVDSTSWVKYSAYGWICLPRWTKATGFRYDRPPLVVNMSWRSPFKADRNKHLDNSMESVRDNVMRWLAHTKVPLGKVDKDGNELVKGVVSSHECRSTANLHYFQDLQDSLPEWPWPLSPKISQRHGIKYHKGFGL